MCLRGTSLIVVFLENCFLLVAVAAASDFAPYLLLEGLELRGELCEEGIVGVFLDYVVHDVCMHLEPEDDVRSLPWSRSL